MSGAIDLSPEHEAIVRAILSAHLPAGASVHVFGSRATGRTHRMSDLDLAIRADAPLTLDTRGALNEAFDESDLPWKVDVIDWTTTDERFRARIAGDLRVLVEGVAPAERANVGAVGFTRSRDV